MQTRNSILFTVAILCWLFSASCERPTVDGSESNVTTAIQIDEAHTWFDQQKSTTTASRATNVNDRHNQLKTANWTAAFSFGNGVLVPVIYDENLSFLSDAHPNRLMPKIT